MACTDCKSYKAVVKQTSEGVTSPQELLMLVRKRIINKHGEDTILAALTGVVSDAEIDMLAQYVAESAILEDNKNKCIEKMREICNREFEEQMKKTSDNPMCKRAFRPDSPCRDRSRRKCVSEC